MTRPDGGSCGGSGQSAKAAAPCRCAWRNASGCWAGAAGKDRATRPDTSGFNHPSLARSLASAAVDAPSREGGSTQIWVQDFDPASGTLTGDARKVTSISTEASGGTWSPDGKSILFVSSVYPECTDDACNKQRDEERAKSKVKAMTFDHLMFRHWTHYDDGKRSHLFMVSIDGGAARDLTPGNFDVPPFSLGGQDQYVFSPDGKEVAYTCNTDEVQAISTNSDVFVVPSAGGTSKRITTNPGSDSTPVYSPDGK